jgi:adenosylmethionine-8-amino-7-oxononanoate aminotransferase
MMAGAPMAADRFQVTPPLLTSKTMGSGLLALGSSIVTRNLRPPTSRRYFS